MQVFRYGSRYAPVLVNFETQKIGLHVVYSCIKHANLSFWDLNCLKSVNSSRNDSKVEDFATRWQHFNMGIGFPHCGFILRQKNRFACFIHVYKTRKPIY